MKNLICAVCVFLFACSLSAQELAIKSINDFTSCVKAGFPIKKSMPPSCTGPDGKTYIATEANPILSKETCKDLCGNGKCEEITCAAVGCPCPESAESCPQDCHP